MDPRDLNIYTDGSSRKRRGGVGIKIIYPEASGRAPEYASTDSFTNADAAEMELVAFMTALDVVRKTNLKGIDIGQVVIHTDNQGFVDNYPRALHQWRSNDWRKNSGEPVANANLWKKVLAFAKAIRYPVRVVKVEGHSSDLDNREVDALAKRSARSPIRREFKKTNARRKTSPFMTRKGSVTITGQEMTIRSVESEYIATHKLYRIRYEVVSLCPDLGKLDFVHSREPLRVGHLFTVKFCSDPAYPQIEKIVERL